MTFTESALTGEEPTESTVSSPVREILRLLVKAQKAQRLYEGRNAVATRLEKDLFERLSRHLETQGEIQLTVLEFELKHADEVVYEGRDRNDSLSFLLYRDGIRRLSFHPGLEPRELERFMACLNRVAVLANDQDDLVTLFWEEDFDAIRYFAIEELTTTDSYPRLEDQLSSGRLQGDSVGSSGAEAVALDLEQPVSTVPVEACRLVDDEIEALRAELASESEMPFHHAVVELAMELTILESNDEEKDELCRNLIAIADSLIEDGSLDELVGMHEHVDGLASMVFREDPAVQALAKALQDALSRPERLQRLLERVQEHNRPKPEQLSAFLSRFGPGVSATLIEWMGRFSSPAYRRAVTGVLLASDDGGLDAIAEHLPLEGPAAETPEYRDHRQRVREVLHALSHHPGEKAIPILERFLGANDSETRRDSFVAVSRYHECRVEELSLDALDDRDPEIRSTALDTLVRRGREELGREILERSLAAPDFDERSLNEKRRIFAAVAKLAGESVLERLHALLMEQEDRWFASKKEKDLAEAVAHGIRFIGTEAALENLRDCAENGARFVKAACTKELESGAARQGQSGSS